MLDPSLDFEAIVDGLEPITFRPVVNPNAELITNGDFDATLVGWTGSGGGEQWEDGMAMVPGGAGIDQSIVTVAGQTYRGSFTAYLGGDVETLTVRIGTTLFGVEVDQVDFDGAGSARREFEFTATGATTHVSVAGHLQTWRLDDFSVRKVADTAIEKALRRPTSGIGGASRRLGTGEGTPDDGRYRVADMRWHVQSNRVSGPFSLGDVIVDADGVKWTIFESDPHTLQARWIGVAVDLSVRSEVATLIDFYRLVGAKGLTHAETLTPLKVAGACRAMVNVDDVDVETLGGQRASIRRATVVSEVRLPTSRTYPLMKVTLDGLDYLLARELNDGGTLTELPMYQFESAPWRVW